MAENPLDLAGRRVLVTGASAGIGRETAILPGALIARLVLAGRNEQRLRETLAFLDGEGHSMEVVDLAAVEQISEWMRRIAAGGGPLSGLVHAAGEQITAPIRALSPQSLDSLMKTNLRSAVMLALELARDRIRVNCVAPAFVQTGMLDRVREMLTAEQFAALEQAHPLGFGTPRDMAHAIAFLLADTGRWITGSTLVVDGGYSAQ